MNIFITYSEGCFANSFLHLRYFTLMDQNTAALFLLLLLLPLLVWLLTCWFAVGGNDSILLNNFVRVWMMMMKWLPATLNPDSSAHYWIISKRATMSPLKNIEKTTTLAQSESSLSVQTKRSRKAVQNNQIVLSITWLEFSRGYLKSVAPPAQLAFEWRLQKVQLRRGDNGRTFERFWIV